jgi:hypothetical protein
MKLCKVLRKTKEAAYTALTKRKNASMEKRYVSVPFANRIVLVPHCLRNHEVCKAKDHGSYYMCVQCGKCKISDISKKCKELGYQGLYILKGGRTIEQLIAKEHPGAIIGVACSFEGAQGMELCEKHDLTVQFVPLTKDGCVNTDLDIDDVFATLEKHS